MLPTKFKNPNLGMQNLESYKWGDKGIPTRENCNLNNPKEMFLWMFTAMPGVNGAPLMLPPDFWMIISEHLYELGARLVAEPIKKYRPPTSSEPHWATSPGYWVPIDTPDTEIDPAQRIWNKLSPVQKAEIWAIAQAWHNNTELPYAEDSPSRKAWESMNTNAKQKIFEVAEAEHEGQP